MGNYYLKTKTGEIITTTKQRGYSQAVSFFAKRKKISEEELLKIYKVIQG